MPAHRKNPRDEVTRAALRQVGEELYGEGRWYAAMARALQPHSPGSGTLVATMVRHWDRGTRSMPAWVPPALDLVVEAEVERLDSTVEALRERRPVLLSLRHLPKSRPVDEEPPGPPSTDEPGWTDRDLEGHDD